MEPGGEARSPSVGHNALPEEAPLKSGPAPISAEMQSTHQTISELGSAPAGKVELKILAATSAMSMVVAGAALALTVLWSDGEIALIICLSAGIFSLAAGGFTLRAFYHRQEFLGAASAMTLDLRALPRNFIHDRFAIEHAPTRHSLESRLTEARYLRNGLLISGDRESAYALQGAIDWILREGEDN